VVRIPPERAQSISRGDNFRRTPDLADTHTVRSAKLLRTGMELEYGAAPDSLRKREGTVAPMPGTRNRPARPSTRKGFSLTEVLLVLSLLGIVTAIAMPTVSRSLAS